MAKCRINFPDKLQYKFEQFSKKTDEIMQKAVKAGAAAAKPIFEQSAKSIVGSAPNSRSTGELVHAIGATDAKPTADGYDTKIGFYDVRSNSKTSNELIANTIEYGKSGQPPKPMLNVDTRRKMRAAARKAMVEVLQQEADKL